MQINPKTLREKRLLEPHILMATDEQDLQVLADIAENDIGYLDGTVLIAYPIPLVETTADMVTAAGRDTDVVSAAAYMHRKIMEMVAQYPRLKDLPIYWAGLVRPRLVKLPKLVTFDRESTDLAQRDGLHRLLANVSGELPEEFVESEPEDGIVAVQTTDAVGQWIRKEPRDDADTVGALDAGFIGYVASDEAHLIGQAGAWVRIEAAWVEGYTAAQFLERKK